MKKYFQKYIKNDIIIHFVCLLLLYCNFQHFLYLHSAYSYFAICAILIGLIAAF